MRAILAAVLVVLSVTNFAWADFQEGVTAQANKFDGWFAAVGGDYPTALRIWLPLAKQGDTLAQNGIGTMYLHGHGVAQDYATAVKWFRKAADQGYEIAQNYLGRIYLHGKGVPQDYATAVSWFRKAADQGLSDAQYFLGSMYDKGRGVRQDYAEAVSWYRKAADQGYASAQFKLGFRYYKGQDYKGQGVPQDYATAVSWFRKAADQGLSDAQYFLGSMYDKGRGVARDYATAVKWYRKAADQGNAVAQFELGVMYYNGQEVAQDYVQAHKWFNLATAQGFSLAIKKRDIVAKRMTNAQVAEAQRLARAWRPRPKQQVATTIAKPSPATPREVSPSINFGRYHALVIGANNYRSLPRLKTAVGDAEAVAHMLRRNYGFAVTTLLDATRADVLTALDGLRGKLTERDNVLIYYAGHGWLDTEAERGFWLPVDASPSNRVNWVSNVTVTDAVKAIKAKRVMVVADSCFSGTLSRTARRGLRVTHRAPDYISRVLGKKSRTVFTSGGLEPVMDSGGSGHSVFAKAFLDALRDNRAVMDGTRLFAMVREQVLLNARQTPQYQNIRFAGHEVGGDFLFVRKNDHQPAPQARQAGTKAEVQMPGP
jgi:TPR repeat protein